MRTQMSAGGIAYFDENGNVRAGLDYDGFSYLDENGKTRAHLGVVEIISKVTGQESRYPAGVALFDDDGEVIWMAPQ